MYSTRSALLNLGGRYGESVHDHRLSWVAGCHGRGGEPVHRPSGIAEPVRGE